MSLLWIFTLLTSLATIAAAKFSDNGSGNLVVYWGQDSAGSQQGLSFYCQDDTIDVIPLAFLYTFFADGGQPILDLSNICGPFGGRTFPGTQLADCSFMQDDIKFCQSKGKLVTLSLGGATANVGFDNDGQAGGFADTIWNTFLGGSSGQRPFGDAVLDGVDLDIENGSPDHYTAFVQRLRLLFDNDRSKRYYISAAPQCPFPDEKIGQALSSAPFDAVYVQFYNNYCSTSVPSQFNFATWDNWARFNSPNPNIKIYLGAPASPSAAGEGYVDAGTLINVALDAQRQYPSFGGVMLWDVDQAYANNRYDKAIKNGISSGQPVDQPAGPSATMTTENGVGSESPNPGPSPTATTTTTTTTPTATTTATTTPPFTSITFEAFQFQDPRAKGRVRRPNPLGSFYLETTIVENAATATPTPMDN